MRYTTPILIAMLLIQLAVPLWTVRSQEHIRKEGELFTFATQPVDPVDIFRGRYVNIRTDMDCFYYGETLSGQHHGFGTLTRNEDGNAEFEEFLLSPPTDGRPYMPVFGYIWSGETDTDNTEVKQMMRVTLPYSRYYMNEKMAPKAEDFMRKLGANAEADKLTMGIRVLDGKTSLDKLYYKGEPLESLLD